MTPDEHEILRLKMRILALQSLFDWIVDVQRLHYDLLPESSRVQVLSSIENLLSERRQEFSTLTLDNLHPVESDLRTALFQEAFDELSSKLFNTLNSGLTPQEIERFKGFRS